jgi:hypothetical protein
VSKRLALSGGAEIAHELEAEIERIRARLTANEAERKEFEVVLRDLVSRCSAATAANNSSPRHCRRAGDHGRVIHHGKDRAVSAPVRRPR